MTPDQYHARVLAALDTMRSPAKDTIILGLIAALYPQGDPDHEVEATRFVAEAVRLTTAFHPDHLKLPELASAGEADADVPEF